VVGRDLGDLGSAGWVARLRLDLEIVALVA